MLSYLRIPLLSVLFSPPFLRFCPFFFPPPTLSPLFIPLFLVLAAFSAFTITVLALPDHQTPTPIFNPSGVPGTLQFSQGHPIDDGVASVTSPSASDARRVSAGMSTVWESFSTPFCLAFAGLESLFVKEG